MKTYEMQDDKEKLHNSETARSWEDGTANGNRL